MRVSSLAMQLAFCGQLATGFTPLVTRSHQVSWTRDARPSSRVFSSQWDDEEEDEDSKPTSFEDAGVKLREEEDKKAMDSASDYDRNPLYNSADIERFRAAIKQRADSLGIEEAKVSKEMIKEKEERVKAALESGADMSQMSQMLDLSQISSTAPRGEDEDKPSIFYEPEDDMTEEEMKEADPDGFKSIPDWAMKELSLTTWPSPLAALKEVAILIAAVALTTTFIVNWDAFLREFYTNLGFIPRPEDIMQGSENLVLPDGWTDGMSEDDFMKFQDEVGKAASSAASSVSSTFSDL
eukprot:CAMPEP_0176007070 /NCGR_PEP_ID=MMETSP0120_2-20121206/3043_1 /TAXON_ID=160619 /ORGANISM="Kryptoperidinium foliaceum, Strain CCMP 1326" /LENGTH=295 /DNA_ID=CAMNT_0017339819 /DNA_START=62 /DNA_END=949 /DNA_ORIENTATION=-